MERNYATQMDAARRGIVTPELKKVAEKEYMAVEDLMPLVASGKVAIPANKLHTCIDPEGIGSMLRTKINVNLGVSKDCKDYDVEMQKVLSAVNMGAEAIMDLSSHGNTQPFRRKLTSECPAMIGTVPVYDSVIHYQRDLATLSAKDFILSGNCLQSSNSTHRSNLPISRHNSALKRRSLSRVESSSSINFDA